MKAYGLVPKGKISVRIQHHYKGRAHKTQTYSVFGHTFDEVEAAVEAALDSNFGGSEEEIEDEPDEDEEEEETPPPTPARRKRVKK
jgi:hypothetical protein